MRIGKEEGVCQKKERRTRGRNGRRFVSLRKSKWDSVFEKRKIGFSSSGSFCEQRKPLPIIPYRNRDVFPGDKRPEDESAGDCRTVLAHGVAQPCVPTAESEIRSLQSGNPIEAFPLPEFTEQALPSPIRKYPSDPRKDKDPPERSCRSHYRG